ncbi:MAG TPA: GNAT family N-acetyltransferase [Chloroflexia bacterium]|nr:GNAT family N-acetyltransferase [Chloroflexia bacterium]
MANTSELAERFLSALVAKDAATVAALLSDDAALRISGWRGSEAYRPRDRVLARLQAEWAGWPDPRLEIFTVLGDAARVAVEFRIQVTEQGRYLEHNRAAFFTVAGERITLIDLYCPESMPSAHRKGWIAPVTLSEAEIKRALVEMRSRFDLREWLPPILNTQFSLRGGRGGSGDAHPGSNGAGGAHWTAEEADARIEEMIAYHRDRGIGFTWYVEDDNTPADLAARLERHGLVRAGDQATMARVGLDNLEDIPTYPDVTVEVLDGSDLDAIEAGLQITARCFNWTPEQVDQWRPGMVERMQNPKLREEEITYLARLNGTPVAEAVLQLRAGIAYLGGAATLPEYRGRRIYSTLLRRRLEDARARGYQIAAIDAEPMSRRVVARYGFKEYARTYVYGWMPVIDVAVIRSLVPDE